EDDAGVCPRLRELLGELLADRVALERAHGNAPDHHAGKRAGREGLLRARTRAEGDGHEDEWREDQLAGEPPRGAKLAWFASRDDRHLCSCLPSDASLTHTLEQGACRTGLAR